MPKTNPRKLDVDATLKKLEAKDPGLKRLLRKAHAYAVFPSVGKAGVVVGGGYGRGVVFEKGKRVGFATISQMTIGVQLGGDTFSEVVVFESPEAFERFKRGATRFAANASAVLIKAGAATSKNFEKGVAVYVWPEGGMLLEAGMGGQRFRFKPAEPERERDEEQDDAQAEDRAQDQSDEQADEDEQRDEEEDEDGAHARGEAEDSSERENEAGEEGEEDSAGIGGRARGLADMARRHPFVATVAGVTLATGIAYLVVKAVRGAGEGESEDQEQDEGAQDSAEESDDEASEEQDDSGDSEDAGDESRGNRGGFSRMMSRGRSRP